MVKGKGTQSFGKRHTKVHNECRRCGRKTYHIQRKRCSRCAFPAKKMRMYNWSKKVRGRRGEGTGRMKHIREVRRKAKNNFRHNTFPKSKPRNNA